MEILKIERKSRFCPLTTIAEKKFKCSYLCTSFLYYMPFFLAAIYMIMFVVSQYFGYHIYALTIIWMKVVFDSNNTLLRKSVDTLRKCCIRLSIMKTITRLYFVITLSFAIQHDRKHHKHIIIWYWLPLFHSVLFLLQFMWFI